MAALVGLSLRTVQRIWDAHRLQPHRVRTLTRSNDPAFSEKVKDIVGLYMSPPAHAVILSIDEKSQTQALSRTRPGSLVKPGHPATQPHDYERHGTTLFAELDVLDGTLLGRCMQRHRHQEFIRLLNAGEGSVPAGKVAHAILGNYAVHKHPRVRVAVAPSPLGVSLHPYLGIMDECRRGLLLGPDTTVAKAGRLPLGRGPPDRHPPLHRRAQRRPAPLHLDQAGPGHPTPPQPPR